MLKEIANRKIRLVAPMGYGYEEIPGAITVTKLSDGRYMCVIYSCRFGGSREIGFMTFPKKLGISEMIERTVNTIQGYKLAAI